MTLAAGARLQDRYEIRSVLGQGGMGTVYLAEHIELERLVAVKVLTSLDSPDGDDMKRFRREAKLAAKLEGENVVRVLDFCAPKGDFPYIVFEHLKGTDVAQELRRRERIDVATAVDWTLQMLAGLAEAHALGIIHRDLKPSNLFLVRHRDGTESIKVMDFGISRPVLVSEQSAVTDTDVMMGTPAYSAPEVVASVRRATVRSDLWSVGVTLYQLVTGTLPFSGETTFDVLEAVTKGRFSPASTRCADLPAGLDAIIARCLSVAQEERPRDAFALASDLIPFASSSGRTFANRIAGHLGHAELAPAPPTLQSTVRLADVPAPAGPAVLFDATARLGAPQRAAVPSPAVIAPATERQGPRPTAITTGGLALAFALVVAGIVTWAKYREPAADRAVVSPASTQSDPHPLAPSSSSSGPAVAALPVTLPQATASAALPVRRSAQPPARPRPDGGRPQAATNAEPTKGSAWIDDRF